MPNESHQLIELRRMLRAFVEGHNRTLDFANEIEALVLSAFPDDDELESLLVALASYRPGGGEYLFDENRMRQECLDALAGIEARLSRPSGG